MHPQWLGDLLTDGDFWIEAGERVLKDDLRPAVHRQLLSRVGIAQVNAVENHLTAVGGDQANCRPAQGRLARTGLTNQADNFPTANFQTGRK